MYKCWKCKKTIKSLDEAFIRCPYCGSRILFKERPPIAKDVKAE
jgi:DNA-directed RNA polymerase subunit RPC12/RpoP